MPLASRLTPPAVSLTPYPSPKDKVARVSSRTSVFPRHRAIPAPPHSLPCRPNPLPLAVRQKGTLLRIFGIILAGGHARRMGGADKAMAIFGDRPLLAHVVQRFAPQVDQLALSANGDPARFADLDLPVLPDTDQKGPLSGILQSLLWAASHGATAVVSAPVDGPFLPPDLVTRLCVAAEATGLALAASNGTLHPTYGLWPVALAPALAAFLASGAKTRVRDFALTHHAGIATFPDDCAFANANTPEDLIRLAAHLAAS